MTQPHATITTDKDGTVHAVSPQHKLTILPDGPARAFNRVFKDYKMGGGPLHARLNNLAARIQQGQITQEDAADEVCSWVDGWRADDETRWLVGELNGVRVYINDNHFIMTTQDLRK